VDVYVDTTDGALASASRTGTFSGIAVGVPSCAGGYQLKAPGSQNVRPDRGRSRIAVNGRARFGGVRMGSAARPETRKLVPGLAHTSA
jgi:hypothetical protein